ncbi:sodium:proton antiporter [Glaesserella parasuis]|uniref:Sodium:proton antiporter n=2 Tax=Glaesserella parasuis TaxID=738 RepID=A0AAJ6AFS5_GLAPU|nr:sodium:proton antiporter [Glaesserella parasuis]EQA05643.1 sodium/hydrogen exchanger family protein [Glaesserella parasuis 12939]EQA13020.1 sodium/hydrogen exchanger family protein [Glaesserella parasuis 174]EQA13329.1 sodium/hydrogen exchanger family protein [Glaesserella parasuis SW140]ATW43553.1 sodium:proton antiporter [Glaesserella parasuis D74]EQA09861.1 sodium/hydrogen exchanger family protein [Glaesserella parasuis D74]
MGIYAYICFLSALSILLGFVTHKISDKIQSTIAITAAAMIGSLLLLLLGTFGWFNLGAVATEVMEQIDFKSFLLNGILGFLLFAGSLGIKLPVLKDQKWEITIFALFSTLASTLIIGFFVYGVANLIGLQIGLIYCIVFGALISPTDPIAVLAIIKNLRAPKRLSMQVEGESLFNDGVGLVIFVTIFAVAFGGQEASFGGIMSLFLHEAIGGILFGFVLGFLAHILISSTDDGSLEILLTLTIPTAGFMFANNVLHVSGALAMVVAGIMIGNWTRRSGFSEQSQRYLDHFWEMIDHFLNSLLFFLIGFAILLVDFNIYGIMMMILAIPICLASRYISLWLPYKVLQQFRTYNPYTLRIMSWGGLRGGLALAMALSIPAKTAYANGIDVKDLILVMTYSVVMFSILVQGTTIEPMIRKSKQVDPNREEYLQPQSQSDAKH